MRGLALVALALVIAGATPAAAQSEHDRALSDLRKADDVTARRVAVRRLADIGVMADLPALAQALRDPDTLVRGFTESAMWKVWSRSGNAEVDAVFESGIEQLNQGNLEAAARTFSDVIRREPKFAEGWNKRATVYFLLGEYKKSLADCDEVMARNPYHWGALSGYGMNYMRLDLPGRAIEFFEKALAVNPNLDQVAQTIEALKALLRERRRDMI